MKSRKEQNGYVAEVRNAIISLRVLHAKVSKLVIDINYDGNNDRNLDIGKHTLAMEEQLDRISENLDGLEASLEG